MLSHTTLHHRNHPFHHHTATTFPTKTTPIFLPITTTNHHHPPLTYSQNPQNPPTQTHQDHPFTHRTHNSTPWSPKDHIFELTLSKKSPPKFPGSSHGGKPHGNDLSTPNLDALLSGGGEGDESEDTIFTSQHEKDQILELALSRKRPPQFPGSIYGRNSHGNDLPTPNLETLLRAGDESEVLLRAIEIRRNVSLKVFVDVMVKKGKFGITYSKNLGGLLGGFLDLVMIEAASMKKDSGFERLSFNTRARIFIEDSHVVPLIRWLKHNSLSYPQIAKMICMSKGNLKYIRNLVEWLKSIHVNGRYLGVVFMRVGETILSRSIEELDETVLYLESKGVRRDWMGYVVSRCSELLGFTMEELKTRVSFYIDMGMNEHDFGTMVYDCPKVLGYFSLEEMKQKVNYLKEFGLSDEDVGRLLAFKPQLMACSIEERWKPLLKLLYYLGIDRDGMKRILVIKPMVFCADLETTIVPKVHFLQEIGIKTDAIGRMLVRFPPLLTYSLFKKIRPVVVFLLTKAGVTQKDISKVVASAPELLGCSIAHKLDGNVKFYLSLGISLRQLGQMIADFPILLRYNVELLRPKYRYLRRTMIRPLQDVIEFPRFFSYSLEDKIIPRHKVMVENRVNFKLRYMLAGTDDEFNQRVEAAVEKRRMFERGQADGYKVEGKSKVERSV